MQVKFYATGVGARIPKTNFGLNVTSGLYIMVRSNVNGIPKSYGVHLLMPRLGPTGTLYAGHVETKWITLDTNTYPWLTSINDFVGKTVDMEINGLVAVKGRVSIKLSVLKDDVTPTELLDIVNVKASGFLPGTIRTTGQFKKFGGHTVSIINNQANSYA